MPDVSKARLARNVGRRVGYMPSSTLIGVNPSSNQQDILYIVYIQIVISKISYISCNSNTKKTPSLYTVQFKY